jgi:hypothetical protein
VSANQSTDYTGIFQSVTVSGFVRNAAGAGLKDVELKGLPTSPVTDASGYYSGPVSLGWSGTVSPTKAGYLFNPRSTTYASISGDQSTDYVGTQQQSFTISGYVRTPAGAPIGGVTLGGLPASPVTDSSGFYSSVVGLGWSGTVTPTKSGYVFTPSSTTYTTVSSDQSTNYTGTQVQTYLIYGYVRTAAGGAINAVAMAGLPGSTSTDVNGYYSATVNSGWSGTVTPTKSGYTFSPTSVTYSNVTLNQVTDYTGSQQITHTISGYVRSAGGAGIGGVVLNGLPANPTTDQAGYYSAIVSSGWSGTGTPTKSGFSFVPTATTYVNVGANLASDYTGTPPASSEGTDGAELREFKLHQNYPNPFNPSTTIVYEVSAECHVTLAVFSTLGRQVASLVDQHRQPGMYAVKLDASQLESGVYFYRLQISGIGRASMQGHIETRKLLLLR